MNPFSRLTSLLERALPNVIRRRYAAKFGVVLLLIALVMGGAGAYIHFDTKSVVESQTESQIRGAAATEAKSVSDWVTSKESTVSFLAESLADQPAGTPAADHQRWLEGKLIQLSGDVRSLHYVDADTGAVVASTTDSATGQSLDSLSAPWADDAAALASGQSVTVTEPYESGGEPVVAFAAPVSGANGAIVLTASLEAGSHQFESPYATGDTKVVSESGTILFDNRKASILDQYAAADGSSIEAIDAALSGQTGYEVVSARTGMESGEYAMAYAPITGTDWVLTYHVPADRAFALQSQVTTNVMLLVAFGVGALFLVGATMGRGTARSLSVVARNADDIANGEVDGDLPNTARIDEMGRLYDSFESMQAYLTTVAGQAEALADKRFDDPVLDEDIPGSFGESMGQTHTELEALITELEAKAAEFSETMADAADGDLTRRMSEDADNDAMNEMARSFNDMADELEATVAEVVEFAETVAAASQEVTASSQEIERASRQVSESTQVMAEGAHEQRENLRQTTSETSNLSATIEEVASSASELEETAQHTLEASEDGHEAAANAIDTIETVETQTRRTVDRIEDLEGDMAEIGDIVELITDIAEQTNILALNANIEAARAGDGRRGLLGRRQRGQGARRRDQGLRRGNRGDHRGGPSEVRGVRLRDARDPRRRRLRRRRGPDRPRLAGHHRRERPRDDRRRRRNQPDHGRAGRLDRGGRVDDGPRVRYQRRDRRARRVGRGRGRRTDRLAQRGLRRRGPPRHPVRAADVARLRVHRRPRRCGPRRCVRRRRRRVDRRT